MRQIQIDPCDVLFFRDCKPFAGGEQSVAAVRFPPLPLPFVGALRSVMLESLGRDTGKNKDKLLDDPEITALVGKPDDPSPLSFSGPFLVRETDGEQQLFLPCPSDVLQVKYKINDQERTKYTKLVPEKKPLLPGVCVNEPNMVLRAGEMEGKAEASQGLMLNIHTFTSYLLGEMDDNEDDGIISSADYFQKEQRTGIALEPGRRTTQQGMLYSADFVRLKPGYSLLMKVDSSADLDFLPDQGSLRLGGEGKHAFYKSLPDKDFFSDIESVREEIEDKICESQKFKLCLLSPAIFQNGWIPDNVDPHDLSLSINHQQFRLKGAAVPKPMNIGGWDLKNKRPRPLFRAAPAGSVYFFEADNEVSEETAKAVMNSFFLKCAMKESNDSRWLPPLYRASGFGLSVVGSWDYL